MSTTQALTVAIPARWLWALRVGGAAIGLGVAFVLGPLTGVLGEHEDVLPGPLRLLSDVPLWVAAPVLAIAGLGAGFYVTREWQREVGVVTVGEREVTVERDGRSTRVDRGRVREVLVEGEDLVLLGDDRGELLRSRTDSVLVGRLGRAFEARGYPWRGTGSG